MELYWFNIVCLDMNSDFNNKEDFRFLFCFCYLGVEFLENCLIIVKFN